VREGSALLNAHFLVFFRLLIIYRVVVIIYSMKMRLTKYGWPQVVVFPVLILSAMVLCLLIGLNSWSIWVVYTAEAILAVLLVWVLCFFRDPHRQIPCEKHLVLAPADGTITDIETIDENSPLSEPAIRIGIFLSVFNTHINRAPCDVKVEKVTYKMGRYKNAANPASGKTNESNALTLVRRDVPGDKLIVRQISGAIARRIVCKAKEGETLHAGEKFGMIKFGSRTEIYLPLRDNLKSIVKKGDKVKAGESILIKYE